MDWDKLICSTKPVTLGERILSQRSAAGNYEAMAQFIQLRTNLTEEDILALDDDDLIKIINLISVSMVAGISLQKLAGELNLG